MVAFGVAALAVFAFFMTTKVFDEDLIRFTVTVIGVAAGVSSASYIGEGLNANSRARREERALALISTWNSAHYSTIRSRSLREVGDAIAHKDPAKSAPEVIQELLKNDLDLEEDIVTVMNFLEEVAVSVEMDLADEEILRNYFERIIPRMAYVFGPWIAERRNTKNKALYTSLTDLANDWDPNNTLGK